MKRSISIDQLEIGMFVEADVTSVSIDGEMHHYLEMRNATFFKPSKKKGRLTPRRYNQVINAGGILITVGSLIFEAVF